MTQRWTWKDILIDVPLMVVLGTIALLLSPLLLIGFATYGIYLALLYFAVWIRWCAQGARTFVVYSRSPHWQERFETHLIPMLPTNAIVVNWSDRKSWRRLSLTTQVFNSFLGAYNHTPSAIIFRPFRRAKVIRFYEAYMSYKHGNPTPVLALESELLDSVARL